MLDFASAFSTSAGLEAEVPIMREARAHCRGLLDRLEGRVEASLDLHALQFSMCFRSAFDIDLLHGQVPCDEL